MELLITFHTTYNVLKLEKYAVEKGIKGRIRPVPRKYSANCGLAWIGPIESKEALMALIVDHQIEIAELFTLPPRN